jgi:hypothetical protein
LSAPHVAAQLSKELEDWLPPLRGGGSAALRARMFSVESSIPVRSMIPAAAVESSPGERCKSEEEQESRPGFAQCSTKFAKGESC